jgi:hypothetical protein
MRDGHIVVFLESKNHRDLEMGDFIGMVDVNSVKIGINCVIEVILAFVAAAEHIPGALIVTVEEDGLFTFPGGVSVKTIGGVGLGAGDNVVDNQGFEKEEGSENKNNAEGPSWQRPRKPGVGKDTFEFFILWIHSQATMR